MNILTIYSLNSHPPALNAKWTSAKEFTNSKNAYNSVELILYFLWKKLLLFFTCSEKRICHFCGQLTLYLLYSGSSFPSPFTSTPDGFFKKRGSDIVTPIMLYQQSSGKVNLRTIELPFGLFIQPGMSPTIILCFS